MKDKKNYTINVWAWFWAIVTTICLIVGIYNFDTEQWLLCSICLLPAVLFDLFCWSIFFKDMKYLLTRK